MPPGNVSIANIVSNDQIQIRECNIDRNKYYLYSFQRNHRDIAKKRQVLLPVDIRQLFKELARMTVRAALQEILAFSAMELLPTIPDRKNRPEGHIGRV
uniref:Transposase n=1 Tax=Steinernema glaseri TaxID=37863 RepID=A0A1I7ZPB9_9BILA